MLLVFRCRFADEIFMRIALRLTQKMTTHKKTSPSPKLISETAAQQTQNADMLVIYYTDKLDIRSSDDAGKVALEMFWQSMTQIPNINNEASKISAK
jgi:hypothetical protein